MDNAVKDALSENQEQTINLLCDFFFSPEASSPIQTFCKHTQELMKKKNLTELFEAEATKKLDESFWNNSSPNFTALANALSLCGNGFVFNGKENSLVTKFVLVFQNEDISLSDDIFASASRIIEVFVEYFTEPQPYQFPKEFNNFRFVDIFLPFINESTTFSVLSTSILRIIQSIPSFDSTFSFIRSLSILLCKFLSEHTISTFYSTTETSEGENISSILSQYMNDYQLLLILAVIGRNLRSKEYCDFCFTTIKEMSQLSESSNLTVLDRIFLYNTMNQISPLISPIEEFVDFYGESLLRDFDSSNNLITNALRSIFQTLIKSAGKRPENSEGRIEEQICEHLLKVINPLSFVSKLKTWLLPLLLKHVNSKSIPNEQLIRMAQDPSAGNFVSKCVKCIKSGESAEEGWKTLLEKCREEAVKKCRSCGEMIVLRLILEPTFDNYPNSIDYAFQTFQILAVPKEDDTEAAAILRKGIYDDAWITTTWLMFECLLSSPRSKWKLSNEQIRLLIEVAVQCGNWDVRCASFTVFTVGRFPQNENDSKFIIGAFENLLFFDSPKHISQVKSTFCDFIDRINKRSKTLKQEQITQIEAELLKIACEHMIPSYISSHRQFAFDIAKPILENCPSLLLKIDIDNYVCLRSIFSLFLDSNASLANSSISLIKGLCKTNEQIRERVLKFDQVKDILFPEEKKKIKSDEIESIAEVIARVDSVENWEEQCNLFEEMNQVISRGKVPQEEIVEASKKIFKILLNTRILGVTCRGQIALESIAKKITPAARLESILDRWTTELISTLDHFDMENMRRSAALPYLALSILRLNTPDIMQTKHSIFERLVKTLVEVIKNSSNEDEKNSQEATHSLNMIRMVLTDKVTSPLAEVILPSVFESIFIVLEKIDNWDLVTAANLCLAAVIRKIKKKNVSQEDDNDTKSAKLMNEIDDEFSLKKKNRKMKVNQQSLLLNQFFNKMPNSKECIIRGLQSTSSHLNYLSLLTLSSFSSNSTSSDTDAELQSLVLNHLVTSKDSRMRRLASRSAVAVTNQDDLLSLFERTIQELSHQSFNALHGQIMLLREILQHAELVGVNLDVFVAVGQSFPTVNFSKIPPFIYDNLCFVIHKIRRNELIPTFPIDLNHFYYDEVSVFLYRELINQELSVSAIVAFLLRINASGRINEIGFQNGTRQSYQYDAEDDFNVPLDFNDQLTSNVLVENMPEVNPALLFAGLNFLMENPPQPEKLNSSLLIHLINQRFQSTFAAALIHLLFISLSSNKDMKRRVEIYRLFDVLEDYVLDLSEEMTPVHVSIAEILPLLLEFDKMGTAELEKVINNDKDFDLDKIAKLRFKGHELALRLLIDDVPKVRTMTMIAVSNSLAIGLKSEIVLFEKVLQTLKTESPNSIGDLILRWIKLIYKKIDIDTHGEALCVIVDEFFIVTKLAGALGIDINFDLHQFDNLLNMRKNFVNVALKVVTEKIEKNH